MTVEDEGLLVGRRVTNVDLTVEVFIIEAVDDGVVDGAEVVEVLLASADTTE